MYGDISHEDDVPKIVTIDDAELKPPHQIEKAKITASENGWRTDLSNWGIIWGEIWISSFISPLYIWQKAENLNQWIREVRRGVSGCARRWHTNPPSPSSSPLGYRRHPPSLHQAHQDLLPPP